MAGAGGAGSGAVGGTGAMGGSGGTAGNVECPVGIVEEPGGLCVNTGDDNLNCAVTDKLEPFTGVCAPKGPTCHRSSNRAKECKLMPDEPAVLELRVGLGLTTNMPDSSGLFAAQSKTRSETCSSEQCLLFRFTLPREGGVRVAGEGAAEIAVGKYNCDGTYSFYSNTAGTPRTGEGGPSDDPARWAPRVAKTMFDPTKQGLEQSVVTGMNPGRLLSCNSFYGGAAIDWELCTRGFRFLELDTSEAAGDGIGAFDGTSWSMPGKYEVYAPIDVNNTDVIAGIEIPFCELLAFGPIVEKRPMWTCEDTERCIPDAKPIPGETARVCPYVKLPDSLCPKDDAEAAMFGCHLGAKDNVNSEDGYPEVTCSMTPPTAPLPDNEGQCCDPLGKSMEIPPCNAYRLVNSFSATAAEITDAPRDGLQPVCN